MPVTSCRFRLACGRCAAALCIVLLPAAAQAGGHFDVDDADTLGPGHCQYELWAGRVEQGAAFQHLGPACRVGPVELGVNLDRTHGADGTAQTLGPAVKWTWFGQPDAPPRAAAEFGIGWGLRHPGRPARQFILPLTWQPVASLSLHANLGADWSSRDGARAGRRGVAAEWALDPHASLIVERSRSFGAWTTRGGLRFAFTPALSLDLSAARLRPGGTIFVVGLNHEWER